MDKKVATQWLSTKLSITMTIIVKTSRHWWEGLKWYLSKPVYCKCIFIKKSYFPVDVLLICFAFVCTLNEKFYSLFVTIKLFNNVFKMVVRPVTFHHGQFLYKLKDFSYPWCVFVLNISLNLSLCSILSLTLCLTVHLPKLILSSKLQLPDALYSLYADDIIHSYSQCSYFRYML